MKAFGRTMRFWLPMWMSSLAVAFSGLQWFDAHEQGRLSERPLIDFVIENDPAYDMVGVEITNNGPAPAIINSITFYVDQKAISNMDEVARRGSLDPDLIRSAGLREGDSLGVGATRWLFAHSTKAVKDLDRFLSVLNHRLSIHVVFCSLNGECWERCSIKGRC